MRLRYIAALLLVLAVGACAFSLDADKISATGQAAEAKAKQRPSVLSVRSDYFVQRPVYS